MNVENSVFQENVEQQHKNLVHISFGVLISIRYDNDIRRDIEALTIFVKIKTKVKGIEERIKRKLLL